MSPSLLSWILLEAGVPPSPLLKVDLLNQRVKEGEPLVFLCSTEGGITEKKFHFYKDGVEITSSEEGLFEPATEPTDPLQKASLRIPHASFNHSGEFACSYEEKRSNRWILSSLSPGVNITVEPEFPSKEQSQLAEKKKERGDLGMMEPPAATAASASPVKDSEATYSNIQDSFTRLLLDQQGKTGGQEDAGSSLLQRERLWCGEEGREPSSVLGWGGRGCDVLGGDDAVPPLGVELED
ncbi:hypothetical protein E2320_003644 [Naja naja]|nr:hypothetical protein E2320_003644 [Naja naja]